MTLIIILQVPHTSSTLYYVNFSVTNIFLTIAALL